MIEVTHPERVLFPEAGFSKGDVVAHYARVAGRMLPHIVGRPITMVRYPHGIAAKGFYQKNAGKHFPDFIGRIELPKRGGVTAHPSVDSEDGLCYLANQGTIAVHTTLGRMPHLHHPDRLVMDFDPPPGQVEAARQAAWRYKALLDELDLPSIPLCTGSKGYHVYVATTQSASSSDMGNAARRLGKALLERYPDELTHEFAKKDRHGRVYVDWQRNWSRATVIAPWSLRPLPGAPVAVPITWEELAVTAPDAFKMDGLDDVLTRPDPLVELAQGPVEGAELVARVLARFA